MTYPEQLAPLLVTINGEFRIIITEVKHERPNCTASNLFKIKMHH